MRRKLKDKSVLRWKACKETVTGRMDLTAGDNGWKKDCRKFEEKNQNFIRCRKRKHK